MQKAEEDLLNWVDEYCNENLLKRLNDGREGSPGGGVSREAVKRALDAAMAPHHAELKTWTAKLEAVGSTITDQVADGWTQIHQRLAEFQKERLEQILDVDQLIVQLRKSLAELTDQAEAVRSRAADSMSESADALTAHFTGIERGLSGLNDVLEKLGRERVVVELHRPPRRLWPFGRKPDARRDGGREDGG
jgi:hypothetical protein